MRPKTGHGRRAMRIHPHELLLFEVAHFRAPREPRLVEHLRRCPACGERLLALLRARQREALERRLPAVAVSAGSAEAASRARARDDRCSAILGERAVAPELVETLARHPPARQGVILANHARFQTWGVLELLVERAAEDADDDAEPLARLAIELAGRLDADVYGAELIDDMRARAWALIGYALQARGDLDAAEAAFANAHVHLRRGTGDPLERAFLLHLKAALRDARGAAPEAERLLARAARLFANMGDPQRASRSLVRLAEVRERAGRWESAVEALYQALDRIDPAEEPRLAVGAWRRLLSLLAANGKVMEARGLLARSHPLTSRFPEARHHGSWIKGRIAHQVRQAGEAETAWLAARRGFLAAGAEREAALVALDLAGLYAEQGRVAELVRLVEEVLPVCAACRLERETRAALAYLWQATAAGWPPSTTAKTSAAGSE